MSVWAIMTPVLILGTIFSSIANTAQAAIISLVYSVFVTVFIYKTIKLEEVLPVTMKSSLFYAAVSHGSSPA